MVKPASHSSLYIGILGAGLVGRLLAWRLLLDGHQIQLIEKTPFQQPRSAAHTAAAMISPMSEVVISERAIYDMGVESLALWPQWLKQLNCANEQPVEFQANGSLVVAHHADDTELTQFYSDLNHHLGTDNQAQWLDQQQLRAIEPDIAEQFGRALFLPHEAFLDNRHLLQKLLSAIVELGGKCMDQTEIQLSQTTLLSNSKVDLAQCDAIIDCRGLGARDRHSALRGVRGEVLWVETKEIRLHRPIRLMHPRYKLYVVPKPNNRFIIGATEIESQDSSPVSVQSMLELCSALYTLNPAFAEARILELDANLRPSFQDNLPSVQHSTIDVAGHKKDLLTINGLYRHGYLLAPYLVNKTLQQEIHLIHHHVN